MVFLIIFNLFFAKRDINHIISSTSAFLRKRLQIQGTFKSLIIVVCGIIILESVSFLMILLWFSFFPDNIITEYGGRTNIEAHYLGYCIGVMSPWIIYHIQRLLAFMKIS